MQIRVKPMRRLVVVKGGGDIATGIVHRLFRSGFDVVITEIDKPTVIRRTVAFAEAVYAGAACVEGLEAALAKEEDIGQLLASGKIPVLVDPKANLVRLLKPWAVVDAILAKKNMGTAVTDADVVIGIGPGFTAGQDAHAVVETMRGHDLGRVITQGIALPNTGIPGNIGGFTSERLIKAPNEGIFQAKRKIGDTVCQNDVVAYVDNAPVRAAISGVLRGILQNGLTVYKGMKVGDVDPRCRREHCFSISDKARAVGGGVLEALLWLGGKG
jgi:xanthine dehydrogenase accessory factor